MQKIDRSKFTIYLSSTKYNNIFNYKSHTWKNKFMDMTRDILGADIEFYDPIKDYYSDDYKMACPEDLDAISKCNFVVYIDKVTIGTMLELGLCLFSEKYKKPYGVLTFNKKVYNHPWLSYLCNGENKFMYDNYIDLIMDKIKKPYIKWWSTSITKGM